MQIKAIAEPFPHLVWEGILNDEAVTAMRTRWPGVGNFKDEVPGNYVCSLGPMLRNDFWREFSDIITAKILGMALVAFAPWLSLRYPTPIKMNLPLYSLMQAEGNYGGHDVHTHHYHDPCWMFTALLYLDADAEGHHGTTLLKVKEGVDPAYAAAQTLNWQGLTEEHATVDYKQGRLLVFMDSPISFHAVKPSSGKFGRRILRIHAAAPDSLCEEMYGVSLDVYRAVRRVPAKQGQIVEWMQRDIEQMKYPRAMTQEECMAWKNTVTLQA